LGSAVRFGVGVCLVHEAIDGSLNIADGSEDATLEARRWLVSLAKKPSTAFNQEAEIGVKKVNLACWAIHLRMSGYLWLA
jgi:hypothetical protein